MWDGRAKTVPKYRGESLHNGNGVDGRGRNNPSISAPNLWQIVRRGNRAPTRRPLHAPKRLIFFFGCNFKKRKTPSGVRMGSNRSARPAGGNVHGTATSERSQRFLKKSNTNLSQASWLPLKDLPETDGSMRPQELSHTKAHGGFICKATRTSSNRQSRLWCAHAVRLPVLDVGRTQRHGRTSTR